MSDQYQVFMDMAYIWKSIPSSVPSLMILSSLSSRLISVRSTTWRMSVAMPRTAKKREIPERFSLSNPSCLMELDFYLDRAIIHRPLIEEPCWVNCWRCEKRRSPLSAAESRRERHRPLFFFLLRSANYEIARVLKTF